MICISITVYFGNEIRIARRLVKIWQQDEKLVANSHNEAQSLDDAEVQKNLIKS